MCDKEHGMGVDSKINIDFVPSSKLGGKSEGGSCPFKRRPTAG